jgi:hypothetical protein
LANKRILKTFKPSEMQIIAKVHDLLRFVNNIGDLDASPKKLII